MHVAGRSPLAGNERPIDRPDARHASPHASPAANCAAAPAPDRGDVVMMTAMINPYRAMTPDMMTGTRYLRVACLFVCWLSMSSNPDLLIEMLLCVPPDREDHHFELFAVPEAAPKEARPRARAAPEVDRSEETIGSAVVGSIMLNYQMVE